MTEEKQAGKDESVRWSPLQVYTMALLCLVLGFAVGYLIRGSATTGRPVPADSSAAAPAQMPGAGTMSGAQPTPEQMKKMGDTKAAPLLEQLKKNPNDAETLKKVAQIYLATHQFELAATYFEKAAAVKPSAELLTALGNTYYYAGATDKAIDALNRALKLDPKYADALFNLGMMKWEEKGDAKGAIECWQRLLKTNPNHPRRAEVEQVIAEARKHMSMPENRPAK